MLQTDKDAFCRVEELGDAFRIDELATVADVAGLSRGLARGVWPARRWHARRRGGEKKGQKCSRLHKAAFIQKAYLKAGAGRVALLLLLTVGAAGLAARALSARGLSLAAGHFDEDIGVRKKWNKFEKSSEDATRECAAGS